MPSGLELVVGVVAILAAGGAYVPLDPSYPEDRIAAMLEDSRPPAVLVQRHLAGSLPENRERVEIALDLSASEESAGEPARFRDVAPESLAYTIFTSGSTGRPKGAMNSHRAAVNRLLWMQQTFPLDASDRVLQKTPASFDVSVWELFWPLMTGATEVVALPEGHKDPVYLARTIARERITTVHFVPSMLQAFVEARGAEGCRSLRRVVASGEALPPDLVERWYARFETPLHNLYGPTEAAIDVTHQPTRAGDDRVPIGRPVANTLIHVLDRELRQVPAGVAGELHIGGVQVARGYRRRPALTAERFVPDPLAGSPGERMYKTGDLARWLGEGTVEYLGRLDHQVKLRGFRIELGEIETVLSSHPRVREAVVLARADGGGDRRLVAYVVPAADFEPTLEAVREHVAATLPEYMLPSALVTLEEMPLTPSGKADRRALPAPADPAEAAGAQYVAPRTETERVLADIMADVLGRDRVGAEDGFFALGGHSLLATRVISRAESAFGVDIPLMTLFRRPTLAGLAEVVDGLRRSRTPGGGEPIPAIPRDRELPLSFAQERLWFLDRLDLDRPIYNLPMVLRVRGSLSRRRLAAALEALGRRHETLRTTFAEDADGPRQVIAADPGVSLATVDLCGLPAGRRAEASRRAGRQEVRRPFDLVRGPLARAVLVGRGREEHDLILTFHHIVSDGTSESILIRDLFALYAGEPAASALPELPDPVCGLRRLAAPAPPRGSARGRASTTGGAGWPERRRFSSCRPTTPGRRSRPSAAPPYRCTWAGRSPSASGSFPGAEGRRRS